MGFSRFFKYKKGSIKYSISPSSGLISWCNKAHAPNGKDVNSKLNKVIYQSSIIACPIKLQ